MRSKTCFARADTPRAALALSVPFIAVGAAMFALVNKGYGIADYPGLVATGTLSWFSQGMAWLALALWITRYFPPAWQALWYGPCLVFDDGGDLVLPGSRRLPLNSIKAVRVHRGFFRKLAYIEIMDGAVSLPLLFVQTSSDSLLRSLDPAGNR